METQVAIQKLIQDSADHPILLFDGVCNLCNGSVQFIIDRDPEAVFRFAALQSEIGQQLLTHFELPVKELSSVVLIQDGRTYTHSDAPLKVVENLNGWWKLLRVFRPLPRFLRDGVYNWIAKNRYRWFGREESCRMPTPELRQRFLDV